MGEVFAGRYELVDPIGRGGVGAVWRAWDHRRRRYVAAKVLQQSDAHTLLRFVREQALRIDHPHVLAPASWAADDDKVLFTMDLVRGGSLAHLIGDYGPLPPRYVCLLLDQLLSGLAAVHAEGVIHRDIKPANVLLEATGTRRPHLRLSDFGIALRKGEPRLTETDYVVGTPGYFAPEQMLGAEPDFPADLFATGLLALYLLTGHKPDAQALVERFTAHGVPGAPEEVPEPLWQVLAGLLQPDPGARFRTATGARKALAAAVELLPEEALDEEVVEVFDQLGPLPEGFGPQGPLRERLATPAAGGEGEGRGERTAGSSGALRPGGPAATAPPPPSVTDTGSFTLAPPARSPEDPGPATPPVPEPPVTPPTPVPAPFAGSFRDPGTAPFADRDPDSPGTATPTPSPAPAPTSNPNPALGSFPASDPGPATPRTPAPAPFPAPGYAPPPPPPGIPRHGPAGPVPPAMPPGAPGSPGFSQATTAGLPRDYAATGPYTAPDTPAAAGRAGAAGPHPAVPATGPAVASAPAAATSHRAPVRRRTGPPAKVAVPVLVLALLCYAVGIWALTAG
ncbi:serine/threonine-protein kinase [Streptomyces albus]|uniref:serine/threonine-protein kinase n=1 Tax=Streptomyces albus TaxID=1888 RepID=UPI000559D113|nr:serine/threonine-protein kinase [Streptomyces albus]